ncbi:hypothetical protein Syn7803C17_283 [Synechococcus phage ACG-2014f]|jgi:hypothetical protein|uniref:DUF1825 domain-containing protein n=2 Tax=Atlauavirus tusconc8 TaxID=2734085 RepID=A0A0E3HUC9_9CAUD|nr:hypothetical protein HOQ62_gp286 [Synechococcus phage ACG-2014f_Syn7803C8]AIX29680.1 hypothetical protein Syn7803US30_284 [Synechococcus phage ACG-2014f]AIX21610.1 hypothetical protein Syn7803C8_286 [Synechococcus phage ACG-2014f_Syn7803C8]AIX31627.1 hypothetical protein Syn7803US40_283 [Synechococcus phage ACG-2014f]AIX31916.1 hypothetical protein Syn7803US42_288 [Synechococcus phage ACG-2014f]AIX37126.1 hypothetical protein Syn7803US7_280 [Synechococcus phage ACG-2014f]
MSEFFDSEQVQKALSEIAFLQNKVMMFTAVAAFADEEEQRENIMTLRLLLSKQENMYNRCALSDSEEAKELMIEVMKHFSEHDIPTNQPMGEVFKAIRERVDEIENDLNRFIEEGETDPWFF